MPSADRVKRAAVVLHGSPGAIGSGLARLESVARQEGVERRGVMRLALAQLDVREGTVGAPGQVAVPEVDVPARELPHPLEAVRIVAPMLARERHVTAIDRHALVR